MSSPAHTALTLPQLGYPNFFFVPPRGHSGWLWLGWEAEMKATVTFSSQNLILLSIHATNDTPAWNLLCTYGCPKKNERPKLWASIRDLNDASLIQTEEKQGPWCCIGDFNATLTPEEKQGGRRFDHHAVAKELNHCGLIELGCTGPAYTWSNRRGPGFNIRERLDRALANAPWCSTFPNAMVTSLPRINSDHATILLNTSYPPLHRRRPLRFEAYWTVQPDFGDKLKSTWEEAG